MNLKDIQDDSDYQVIIGDIVLDDEGSKHPVKHKGVAKHPNDLGMKYIVDGIIKGL